MPFLLYQCERLADSTQFTLLRQTNDVASSIGAYVRKRYAETGESPLAWCMSAGDLLLKLKGPLRADALVVDLKPRVKGNVSLYQVRDVWGFSYDEWTPIAVRLESLLSDELVPDPEIAKRSFDDRACSRDRVHEFLYLRGGTKTGTWNWGMVGFVNGALLWPDALKYFVGEITK